ncbi:MAG TPA: branched-chain amino acid ABC transporter permease [Kofleriaceae bacterium]|jgi:branched-chain amino acid transport system permease protein|nr:branched-chain amino acid ABC transporter permease [Kofleriaceae bacterium]
MAAFITVLFDGVAYGSLLFVISVGMSVTMGLMRFINLAHGAFAMFGGYTACVLADRWGLSMFASLPVVLVGFAVVGAVVERVIYRWVSRTRPLDQVLLTIGIAFIATALATAAWGPYQRRLAMPEVLTGQLHVLGVDLGVYRLFLIGMVVAITAVLHALIERTRFGAQMRAAVDQPDAGAGLGIPVNRVFTGSFAIGSGLAAVGGVLGVEQLGLDPNFTFRYMVYFLLVVVVGGQGSVIGSAAAAVALGVFDVVGKYYFPSIGGFLIYALMVVLLLVFPHGLFRRGR